MRLYRAREGVGWLPWIARLATYDTYAVFSRFDPWPSVRSILDLCARAAKKLMRGGRTATGLSRS